MKRIIAALLLTLSLFGVFSLAAFADDAGTGEKSFFAKLGDNIWYILLVLAFSAGLIIITKWSAKIKARDEKFKEDYDAWKKEHPEEADKLENGEAPVQAEQTEEPSEESNEEQNDKEEKKTEE